MAPLLDYHPDCTYDLHPWPAYLKKVSAWFKPEPLLRLQHGRLYSRQSMRADNPEAGLLAYVQYRPGAPRHPLHMRGLTQPYGQIQHGVFIDLLGNRFLMTLSASDDEALCGY